jgi:hypothetical protein
MLYFGVIAERFMLRKKVHVSKSYRSWHKGAVIATCCYRSGNISAVIASKSVALTARQKR